jgi:hypothetical protein
MPRSYKPRVIICPECPRLFTNQGGLTAHRRTHERERRLARAQRQDISAHQQPVPSDRDISEAENDSFDAHRDFDGPYASSRASSEIESGENVRIHPLINGLYQ